MAVKNSKIVAFEELGRVREQNAKRKIVHCHGVFDVLHVGHLAYFQSAKAMGDILVVTITTDRFVNKGPGRPYFTDNVRASMVAALETVDYVAISPFPTAVPSIEGLKPDLYIKGPDYKNKRADITGAIFDEEKAVEAAGGKLAFTDDDVHSSSSLINKFFSQWSEEQQKCIEDVKAAGGLEVIEEVLERLSKETVTIVGEPIVDTYVYCQPEALSSKSPSVSAKFLYQEDYAGGSMAIANHMAGFAKETNLLITHGGEEYYQSLLKEKMNPKVKVLGQVLSAVPTPRKTRYIDVNTSQRFFEVTNLRSDQWSNHESKDFCKKIMDCDRAGQLMILSDFGHGLFEGPVLQSLGDLRSMVALNVQTNSSNFGFNLFTKHKRYDFLCIDTREARLAYHDRNASALDVTRRIRKDVGSRANLSVTLGFGGAALFPKNSDVEFLAPAFADKVVDATGAGDAFFGMVAMLLKVNCPPTVIPFVGNVFAGLKTKIIGNKSSVSKTALLKAVTAILK